ncbi:MAG TPA: putative toxin-antitoxin system toxin component, PIN family [Burkholderiaceae bacterium]|nr:putative toxin-antitoxin system toxin component, PIN family [Burkholderiaceae bacterium]
MGPDTVFLAVVIDTNILMDAFIFNDPAAQPLKQALASGKLHWLATQPMRDELQRVLGYKKVIPRLAFYQLSPTDVMVQFDQHAQLVPVAPKAPVTCRDADDQKFIDLAVAHKAMLLSKDNAVLCMSKRLLALDVIARVAI